MKKICILLNGPIKNDPRVIKIARTISKNNFVDIFYINGSPDDQLLFNDNVQLYHTIKKVGFKTKIIRHTFFYNEYSFLSHQVLKTNKEYDYIYANDLPCLKPALLIKAKKNTKVIYDSHEIYIETLNQFLPTKAKGLKGLFSKFNLKFLKYVGEAAEKKYLKSVDKFITVGQGVKEYFEKKYDYKGIHVVMNCPEFKENLKTIDLHSKLGLTPSTKIVLYQGMLNNGRGLDLLIRSFPLVDKECVLFILGNGPLKDHLIKLTKDLKLENRVFFEKAVPFDDLPSYTSAAFCGINLLENFNLSKSLAAPNKLFEYIHSSIPVIASYSFENNIVFNKFKIGIQTNNNIDEISSSINELIALDTHPFKENCREAALIYSWNQQERILLNVIQ